MRSCERKVDLASDYKVNLKQKVEIMTKMGGGGYKYPAQYDTALSYIRLIAMSMIILCHFLQYYKNELAWWFNVGVQIFFILSGFLYGKKKIDNSIEFIVRQLKKILFPYYIFIIIISGCYIIFAPESINIVRLIKMFFCADEIQGIGHLWFVSYILFCYILTPYLFEIGCKLKRYNVGYFIISVIGLMLAGQIISTVFGSFFDFSCINCYIYGYFLSIGLDNYGYKLKKIIYVITLSGSVLMNEFQIYIQYFLRLSFQGIAEKIFGKYVNYAHMLLGAAIFILLYAVFKNKKSSLATRFTDKYSYYIYLVHQVFILSPLNMMEITPVILVNLIIVLIAIIVCGVILFKLSNPYLFIKNS